MPLATSYRPGHIPMALPVLSLMLILPLLSLPTSSAAPTAHQQVQVHEHHHPNGVKSLRFTLYLQETFNNTAYFIVKGVAGPKQMITKMPKPSKTPLNPLFGSLFAYYDPFTATPDPSSKTHGVMEGSGVTTSFDGKRATSVFSMSINLEGYKGTLLSVGIGDFSKPAELPIVGGTGDFRYVQGYIIEDPFYRSGLTGCFKTDFYLYWPPYAALYHNN